MSTSARPELRGIPHPHKQCQILTRLWPFRGAGIEVATRGVLIVVPRHPRATANWPSGRHRPAIANSADQREVLLAENWAARHKRAKVELLTLDPTNPPPPWLDALVEAACYAA